MKSLLTLIAVILVIFVLAWAYKEYPGFANTVALMFTILSGLALWYFVNSDYDHETD
jgi:hypothetical protein